MKRGESGLSLLVAVNKPVGMSSHDVINRARRVFNERRLGHTGTLDPLASGVLPLCIGPATRLDRYMTAHDKRYRVAIAFGHETTTDDSEGAPTIEGEPAQRLFDESCVHDFLESLIGSHEQVPPQYSAIKVNGKKAYELARSGAEVSLEARPIEIYEASLKSCGLDDETGMLTWVVDFVVSKGTYIRALARDIGRSAGCPAHVAALQRRTSGSIALSDCVSLDTLETLGVDAALDPVAALGFRYAFCDAFERAVSSGSKLPGTAFELNEPLCMSGEQAVCECTTRIVKSDEPPKHGELVSVVIGNRLKAIYSYSGSDGAWNPSCVFSTAVARR